MTGAAGTSGGGGRGGTSGSAGTTGAGGRGGTTGTAGTTGAGGTAAAMPKVITSASGAYWNTSVTITTTTSGNANTTVNDSSPRQTWEGFGGAFNEMGWSYITKLSTSDQTKTMQLLFDANNGAHFVMGRIPIGASDYALTRYTEDETSGDTTLGSFGISRDMMYLIPYVKAAQQVNGSIRFWASPWTPPTWMKNRSGMTATTMTSCTNPVNTMNNMTDTNIFDGGCFVASNSATLANYYVKWIQAYQSMGITIDTIAPQNEPNYSQGYPSAIWDPATYKAFLPMLKSALGSATPPLTTKIMLGTMSNGDNGSTSKDLQVVQAVMMDNTAKTIPTVMGLQWGMLDLYEGKTSGVSPSTFMTGNMPVWATEHKCGNYPWTTSTYKEPAPNDLAYGQESWGYIVDAINKGGVTAYNAWNMVLDTAGKGNDLIRQWAQDALLIVNSSNQLVQTPAYYVFRHASQYAAVGAKVISGSGDSFIAFKNPDGSEVAVINNTGGANANYIVQIKGTKYQFSMPSAGWATVVVP
jgi:glucosylceramidase